MEHYVINLKRRPDRLYFWFGCQRALGLYAVKHEKSDLVHVCYAIDQSDVDLMESCYEHFSRWGGYTALRIGMDIIFEHIANREEGWYCVWIDDHILSVPYDEFMRFFSKLETSPDILAVTCHSAGRDRVKNKIKHPDFELYKGFLPIKSDCCLVLKPAGAKLLLEFARKTGDPYSCYEALFGKDAKGYFGNTSDFFWTTERDLTENLQELMGGVGKEKQLFYFEKEVTDLL